MSNQARNLGVLITVTVIVVASSTRGANAIRITIPTWDANCVSGNAQAIAGNMITARHQTAAGPPPTWHVDFPNVLLEFYFSGMGAPYLVTSKTTPMTFPDASLGRGAFSDSMTLTAPGGWVYPYEIDATALDPFNEVSGYDDFVEIVMVAPK